jgi:hypothetical protein
MITKVIVMPSLSGTNGAEQKEYSTLFILFHRIVVVRNQELTVWLRNPLDTIRDLPCFGRNKP